METLLSLFTAANKYLPEGSMEMVLAPIPTNAFCH